MTKRKLEPAKRGRKPKAPGEKLQQLTVRLPPSQRLGLELIAREHGLSLSEALDRVMSIAIESQVAAGKPVSALITDLGGADLEGSVTPGHRERIAEAILEIPPYLVMHLPHSLRKPHESLFADVYPRILAKAGVSQVLQLALPEADKLLEACLSAHRRGVDPDALVEEWVPIFKAAG